MNKEIDFTENWEVTSIDARDLTDDIKNQLTTKLLSLEDTDKEFYARSVIFQNKNLANNDNKEWVEIWENREFGIKANNITKKRVELPGNNVLISTFADEVVETIKKTDKMFFRESSQETVEITGLGFKEVKPNRLITLVERYFNPWQYSYAANGSKFEVVKSMNQQMANIVLASPNWQDELKQIKRIFPVPMPIIYNEKITFPKKGYDKRFCSWLNYDSPTINPDMKLEEAKKILKKIYSEFCFQDEQDYTNAIAGLITPFLRGLYSSFNVRSPMFCYMANRERAGKDYCAGITGLVLEGYNIEEPPVSSGEFRASGQNDELRKKILASLMSGKKRLHFANNKGKLNNAVLEGFLTSQTFSDRLLGRNDSPTFDNEIDVSISGNIGMTFTADLLNRSRFIKLFLDIEDANKREFKTPNLHKWVLDNRCNIISAIYSLIKNWFDNGKPKGSVPFASFHEWAEICGGIMECAGIGNPCQKDKNDSQAMGVDEETSEMKEFFELIFQMSPDKWLNKQDIKNIIIASEENLFNYMDWENKSDQIKFGKKINSFVGRILSDIRLISDNNPRSVRQKYKFFKEKATFNPKKLENDKKSGHVAMSGHVFSTHENSYIKGNIESGKNIANMTNMTTFNKNQEEFKENIMKIHDFFKKQKKEGNNFIKEDVLKEKFPKIENLDEALDILAQQGQIFQPKLNHWSSL